MQVENVTCFSFSFFHLFLFFLSPIYLPFVHYCNLVGSRSLLMLYIPHLLIAQNYYPIIFIPQLVPHFLHYKKSEKFLGGETLNLFLCLLVCRFLSPWQSMGYSGNNFGVLSVDRIISPLQFSLYLFFFVSSFSFLSYFLFISFFDLSPGALDFHLSFPFYFRLTFLY